MRVCVIGAGPSGLTTIKQLLDEDHAVTCFEKNDNIGGIWYRKEDATADAKEMKVFDNLMLTISRKLMSYSDFMLEGDRIFLTHKEYKEYLYAYANKFGLHKCILLNSTVNEVKKNMDDTWTVSVTTNGRNENHIFDAVAVCSGPFQNPSYQGVPDLNKFSGEIIHSSTYRNNEKFKGKRVLIVGLAESGADITREISNVASEATLSIRNYTFLLPRIFGGTYATDSATVRFHIYEMYVRSLNIPFPYKALFGENMISRVVFMTFAWVYALIGWVLQLFGKKGAKEKTPEKNPLGEPMYPLKVDFGCEATKANMDAINAWNRRTNNYKSTWSPQRIVCKNVSFIPNIVSKKLLVNDSGIDRISGNRVFFKDGDSKEFDALVLCTGFERDFSKLGQDLRVKDNNIRNLYKHAFHPDYAGRLAYIGFVRPYTGGIPIAAEMQARYFAALCSNKLTLPKNLNEVIQKEKVWEENTVCLSLRQNETIPSNQIFIDAMAKEIGCLMPMSKLIFNPRLLVRHWFYPYNQACYRLTGPHSNYEVALKQMMEDKNGAFGAIMAQLHMLMLLPLPYFIHPKYNETVNLETPLKE